MAHSDEIAPIVKAQAPIWRWWVIRPANRPIGLYPGTARDRRPSPLIARHRQRRHHR